MKRSVSDRRLTKPITEGEMMNRPTMIDQLNDKLSLINTHLEIDERLVFKVEETANEDIVTLDEGYYYLDRLYEVLLDWVVPFNDPDFEECWVSESIDSICLDERQAKELIEEAGYDDPLREVDEAYDKWRDSQL